MNTTQHGHDLRSLTNRIIAVIDDAENAHAAVETLERVGIPESELADLSGPEALHQVDAEGAHSGGLTHALRAMQSLLIEGNHLRRYESELASGHHVVDVHVHVGGDWASIVQVLRNHGAHFINAYGQWTIERVAA